MTDPDARLAKKSVGKEAKLSYQASVLLDNRHGLVVATTVSAPSGTAEVEQAIELCATQPPRAGRRTLGADKGYDQRQLITGLRGLGWTPHMAQGPASILDGRTTRHAGYVTSQQRRKRVEESVGWGKTVGLLRKLRHRGRELVDWIFTFTMAAYNLVRLRTLLLAGLAPSAVVSRLGRASQRDHTEPRSGRPNSPPETSSHRSILFQQPARASDPSCGR